MSEIKLILMDIDGTLANNKKEITPKTKEVLMKAQKSSIRLVLASGRPVTGLMRFAKELEMEKNHGLLVCYNGAKVVDCQSGEVLFNQAMSVEEGKAVLQHLKKFDRVRPIIDKDEYMYVNDVYDCYINYNGQPFNVIEYESRSNNYLLAEKKDLAGFVDFPLNKILTTSDPEYLQAHYQEMMEPFKDSLSCMFTSAFYFEFTAQGIDKARALDAVLPKLGYSKENCIAFGDGPNDASMLAYSGISVAMANAVDSLKETADEVTLSNEEDGIAETLLKYLPQLNI